MSGSGAMSGDLRRWRYFVVVAEELHMTRAAQRLLVAQPSLSQQIRRLEADLGVSLFQRRAHGLELTVAGEAFAQEAAQALAVVDRAIEHARELGRGLSGTLRVGFVASAAAELTPAITRTFREQCPDVRIQLRQFQLDDPYAGLRSGLTDVAIIIPPFDCTDLQTHTLFRQPRVVLMSAGHPLAHEPSVDVCDIIEEPFIVAAPGAPQVWRDFWQGDNHRGGTSADVGVEFATIDEKYEHVCFGAGVALSPSSSARYYGRPGVTWRPVPQLEPCEVTLVRRADDTNEMAQAFIDNALLVASARARTDLPPGQLVWAPEAPAPAAA